MNNFEDNEIEENLENPKEEEIRDEISEIQEEEIRDDESEIQEEEIRDDESEIQEEEIRDDESEIQEEEIRDDKLEIQEEEIRDDELEIQEEEIRDNELEIQDELNTSIPDAPIDTIEEGTLDSTDEVSEETIEREEIEKDIEKEMKEFNRNLIEASLYAAGRPLTIEEISHKLELPKKEVEELINEVAFEYLERSTALIIALIGDRYQMQIRPEYTEKVSKFAKGGAIAERYLRTLTIIALKQPILKSMVIKLRGTGAYEHVKYLLDNGFINAVKKGRSQELTTTDKYADMFGLPKDKTELKRAMVTQLGISEETNQNHSESNESEEF
ncbi:MAG: SMC-Scp complex subunit ScpB [Candidatus Thorarchaeota archaeon]